MRKRILSILLAAIMIVTMLPSMVFANGEEQQPALLMKQFQGKTFYAQLQGAVISMQLDENTNVVVDAGAFSKLVFNQITNMQPLASGVKITAEAPYVVGSIPADFTINLTTAMEIESVDMSVVNFMPNVLPGIEMIDLHFEPLKELEKIEGLANVTYPETAIVDGDDCDYALEFNALPEGVTKEDYYDKLVTLYGERLFCGKLLGHPNPNTKSITDRLCYFVCSDDDVEYYKSRVKNGVVELTEAEVRNGDGEYDSEKDCYRRAYILSMNYRVTTEGVEFNDFKYTARLYWRAFYNGMIGHMTPMYLCGGYVDKIDFGESVLGFTPMLQGDSFLPYAWNPGEGNDYCPLLEDFLTDKTFAIGVTYKDGVDKEKLGSMKIELLLEARNQYGLAPIANKQVVFATGEFKMGKEPEVKVVETTEVEIDTIKNEVAQEVADEMQAGQLTQDQTEKLNEAVETTVETLTANTEVVKTETKAAEAVNKEKVSAIIENAVSQAVKSGKLNIDNKFSAMSAAKHTDTKIEVKLESIKVDTQTVVSAQTSTEITVNSAKYDVKPIATVTTTVTTGEGTEAVTETITETVELTDDDLNGKPITIRLAVAPTNAKVAKITHTSDKHPTEEFYAEIQGTGENQYVEIQMTHFSEVEVETLAKTSKTSRLMGHQERSNDSSVGRFIIPITETELNKLGDKIVIVGGDDKTTELTFEVDCVYTYFYDEDKVVAAEGMGYKAFIIVEKDIHGNSFSGYGYYKFYNKNISDDDSTLLFDAAFFKKTNG